MNSMVDRETYQLLVSLLKEEELNASSHWLEYGKVQKISFNKITENQFEVTCEGFGFGHYNRSNLFGIMKDLPTQFFLKFLLKSSERTSRTDLAISESLGFLRSYDSFRMCKTIDYLSAQLNLNDMKTVGIIGDGFGRLGILLKLLYPDITIVQVNLKNNLIFDMLATLKVFPNLNFELNSNKYADFMFFSANNKEAIPVCDLYINIASMQEMDMLEILRYFSLMANSKSTGERYFYCCNRVSKKLPDGTQIKFEEYPWEMLSKVLDESLCSWHQWQPMNKPPFFRRFDGPIKHKLVRI